jgi:hypothetical protein
MELNLYPALNAVLHKFEHKINLIKLQNVFDKSRKKKEGARQGEFIPALKSPCRRYFLSTVLFGVQAKGRFFGD